jgi:hypothetical protein
LRDLDLAELVQCRCPAPKSLRMDLLIRSVAYRMQVARTTKRVRASFYSAKKNTGEMIRMNSSAAVMIIQPCDLCHCGTVG